MSFTVPATWSFLAASNNGNTVQFALPGHTVVAPALVILKRTVPQYQNGVWSKPSYDVKVVRGVVDAAGLPVNPRVQVGTDGIRWPMSGVNVNTALQACVGDFNTIVSHAGFPAAVFAQVFPTVASA